MKFSFAVVLMVALLAVSAFALTRPCDRIAEQVKPTLNQKPITYVLAMNRAKPNGALTLHGNWISLGQNCIHAPAWDEAFVEPIIDEMAKWWPSFNNPNNVFWEHEWTRHLTCEYAFRNGTRTPTQIFLDTIDLLHRYEPHCDNHQATDCRCNLDANYNLIGSSCTQKS